MECYKIQAQYTGSQNRVNKQDKVSPMQVEILLLFDSSPFHPDPRHCNRKRARIAAVLKMKVRPLLWETETETELPKSGSRFLKKKKEKKKNQKGDDLQSCLSDWSWKTLTKMSLRHFWYFKYLMPTKISQVILGDISHGNSHRYAEEVPLLTLLGMFHWISTGWWQCPTHTSQSVMLLAQGCHFQMRP